MSILAFFDSYVGIGLIAILAIFVVFGVVKGVFSIALNLVGVALAGLASYFTYPYAGQITQTFSSDPPSWMPWCVVAVIGLATFIIYKVVLSVFSKLILGGEQGKGNKLVAALLALGGGSGFLWFGNNSLQQFNTAQFMENIQKETNQKVEDKLMEVTSNSLQNLILSAQESWLGEFQSSFDPFQISLRCDTLRLISLEQQGVDFYKLGEEFDLFAYDIGFKRLVNDVDVQNALKQKNFLELFSLPVVKEFTKRDEVKATLKEVDWRTIEIR